MLLVSGTKTWLFVLVTNLCQRRYRYSFLQGIIIKLALLYFILYAFHTSFLHVMCVVFVETVMLLMVLGQQLAN